MKTSREESPARERWHNSSKRALEESPARERWPAQVQRESAGRKSSKRALAQVQQESAGRKSSKRALATNPARERWQQDQQESAGKKTSERMLAIGRPANGRWQSKPSGLFLANIKTSERTLAFDQECPANGCSVEAKPSKRTVVIISPENGRWLSYHVRRGTPREKFCSREVFCTLCTREKFFCMRARGVFVRERVYGL